MIDCPTPDELAILLQDETIEGEHEPLVDHVSQCEACQARLSSLSEMDDDWSGWESLVRTQRFVWPTHEVKSAGVVERKPEVAGYEILRVIGSGGMGVVYQARQVTLNRLVALKMLRSSWRDKPDFRRRFRSEAETLARLEHPNLVQIYDILEHDDCPMLVLEYVDGVSLADHLRDATLAPREAAHIVEKAARAMQCVHDEGIVHRDLKPANILIRRPQTRNGRDTTLLTAPSQETTAAAVEAADPSSDSAIETATIKVTDFGIARCLEEEGITRTGEMVGTPSYMAPEQARGESGWSKPAADVYALGAVLYEGLTGRPPFRGESAYATMMQVVSDEPVAPSKIVRSTPRDLETICLKCLRKDPAKRYATCDELADDLQRHLTGKPILARRQPWWVHLAKSAKRHPAVATLTVATTIAVIVLLVVWMRFTADLRYANNELKLNAEYARLGQGRAEAARKRAERRLLDTSEVLSGFAELVTAEKELKTRSLEPLRQRLLDETLNSYAATLKEMEGRPRLAAVKAGSLHRMSALLRDAGELEESIKYVRQAIAVREEHIQAHGLNAGIDSSLGVMLVDGGKMLKEAGQLEEAKAWAERAIDIFRQASVKPELPDAERVHRLAVAYYVSSISERANDWEKSREQMQAAADEILLAIADESILTLPTERQATIHSMGGAIHRELGGKLLRDGNRAAAKTAYQTAITCMQKAVALRPSHTQYPGLLATSHCCLAVALRRGKENQAALESFERARTVRSEQVEQFPHMPSHLYELGMIYYTTGCIRVDEKDAVGAQADFLAASERLQSLLEQNPENTKYAQGLGVSLHKLAVHGDWSGTEIEDAIDRGLPHLAAWDTPGSPAKRIIDGIRSAQKQHKQPK